jgi:hypothetical protein
MKASAFNLLLGGQKPLSKEELGYVLAAFDQVSLSLQIIPEMSSLIYFQKKPKMFLNKPSDSNQDV